MWDLPVIINLNARSLSIEKLDELNVTVGIHYVSVICVTETWFKDYMGSDSLNLPGFNLERKDRKNGRAGGFACYLRTDLLYSRLIAYEDDELGRVHTTLFRTGRDRSRPVRAQLPVSTRGKLERSFRILETTSRHGTTGRDRSRSVAPCRLCRVDARVGARVRSPNHPLLSHASLTHLFP